MSPAELVAVCLLEDNVGGLPEGIWPVYASHMPDNGDQAICVYDTLGTKDGRLHRGGTTIYHPGIQVRVRGEDYTAAYAKAVEIATYLDNLFQRVVAVETTTQTIQGIHRTSGPIPLGRELDGVRQLFILNAIMTVL